MKIQIQNELASKQTLDKMCLVAQLDYPENRAMRCARKNAEV